MSLTTLRHQELLSKVLQSRIVQNEKGKAYDMLQSWESTYRGVCMVLSIWWGASQQELELIEGCSCVGLLRMDSQQGCDRNIRRH